MHYDQEIGQTFKMTNIIGSFHPEKPSRLILCAHWDTRPFADRDIPQNQPVPIPGANDGASGVAVLLEIAQQLRQAEPPVGIDIIFFDGEDYGKEGDLDNYCLGSRYFVANNSRFFPQFAILLDMIGDAQLSLPKEGYSTHYAPEITDKVWNIAERLGIYQFQPEIRNYVFDDHVILNEGGIPAIDIIDFEYPDASHRYWHTLEDTPDKCSPESLKAVGDVLMELIYNEMPW
jgi:Zn-dependent M28 family amino/carboxypeptidase